MKSHHDPRSCCPLWFYTPAPYVASESDRSLAERGDDANSGSDCQTRRFPPPVSSSEALPKASRNPTLESFLRSEKSTYRCRSVANPNAPLLTEVREAACSGLFRKICENRKTSYFLCIKINNVITFNVLCVGSHFFVLETFV